jgi:hypothetical protein
MTAIDLTPMSIAKSLNGRRRARAWSLGLSSYALALAVGLGAVMLSAPTSEGVRAKVARVQTDVDGARRELAQVSGEMTRLQRELDAARAVGEHPDWSIVLGLIAGVQQGREAVLEHVRLAPVLPTTPNKPALRRRKADTKVQDPPVPIGYEVLLSGLARTELDASKFALGLETVGAFDRVTLVSTRARPVDNVTFTAFEIRIDLNEATSLGTEAP